MDGIAKSPSAVNVTTSTCETLQVSTPEAVAFGMNVREEAADESASVRTRSADTLIDHDYCLPGQTQTETDEPTPKRKKPQLYVRIPASTSVSESTQSRKEPVTQPSYTVRDEALSSSLDSFPESDTNPFDTAFKKARSDEAGKPENQNSVTGDRLEKQYGPFRKSPELRQREQALFHLTTRM